LCSIIYLVSHFASDEFLNQAEGKIAAEARTFGSNDILGFYHQSVDIALA
jgi:hypothetical protein